MISNKKRYIIAIALVIVAVLAANIFANIFAGIINLGLDVTKEQYSALTDTTKTMLAGLNKEVYIYYVGRFEQQDLMTTQLLKSYTLASGKVHYGVLDPINNAQILENIKDNDIKQRSVIISDTNLFSGIQPAKYAVFSYKELFSDFGQQRNNGGPADTMVFSGEQRVTSAIEYIAGGMEDRAVFLTGQDEKKPCSSLISDVTGLFYKSDFQAEVNTLDPSSDTLIVVSPMDDISDTGYANMKEFLDAGGRALFFIDTIRVDENTGETEYPGQLKNFKSLLSQYGLSVNSDVVLGGDPSRTYKSPANIIPTIPPEAAPDFPMDNNIRPVLDYASSITLTDAAGVSSKPLLVTDNSCYAKPVNGPIGSFDKAPDSKMGPFTVGAAVHKDGTSIAVYTTSSFIVSEEDYAYHGNSKLFLNTLSFLNNKPGGASINSKTVYSFRDSSYRLINVPGILRVFLIIVTVCILPVVPIIVGISRRVKRKVQNT
jgi:ABC-2 type transport system permease protein